MNPFDRTLRRMAKEEKADIPESVKNSINAVLVQLPEENVTRYRPRVMPRFALVTASLAFVFLLLMPNISPVYAKAMEKVPVIGDIVRVVTIRNYIYDGDNYDMDIRVPQIEDGVGDAINKDVSELTEILINEFYNELDLHGNKGYGSINMDYNAIVDSKDWFTLKLSISQTAASSDYYFRYYHIDKDKGAVVKLGDLFADESYPEILKEEIKAQMRARMQDDPDTVYWIESKNPKNEFVTIDAGHNFYWNEDGNLVIPFDKYEVGPGSSGCPEFEIPEEVIHDILKPEYRSVN